MATPATIVERKWAMARWAEAHGVVAEPGFNPELGVFCGKSERLLIEIQRALGEPATGVWTPGVQSALFAPVGAEPVLRLGSRGPSVVTLQKALDHHGSRVVVDGIFGPATEAAVRHFQAAAHLVVDGVVGPQTWAKLLPHPAPAPHPTVETLAQRALVIARSQLGVKEHPAGSNDGPQVRLFQATTGAYHAPWCASFAKWSYLEAKATREQLAHATADVTSWLAYPHIGAVHVLPGDLVIYNWNGGDVDHIGLFERWMSGRSGFEAIEGNTAVGNDSNGGEVMRRDRNTEFVAAFVRIPT